MTLQVRQESEVITLDAGQAMQELENRFALAVRQRELLAGYIKGQLKPDKHFYTVGDDPERKPSLTKEGAEIICLAHGLKPHYEIVSGPDKPPMDNSPYQLTVLCRLESNGRFGGEGIGSASSYLTTRLGEYKTRQKDPGLCYNATLKMGQKSAYISATLNATAASEFFTQDLEDGAETEKQEEDKTKHWCEKHQTKFFKSGKMKSFAHPIQGTEPTEWCHETTAKIVEPKQDTPPSNGSPVKAEPPVTTPPEQSTSPTAKDRLFIEIREHKPALKSDKNIIDWLTGPLSIPAQDIETNPDKVLETLKKSQKWS
jgi:hypothetical protein